MLSNHARRLSKAGLLSAVAILLPWAGQAAPIAANPTLSMGSLTFNSFSCSATSESGAAAVGCNQIDVSTIGQPAAGLQIAGGLTALPSTFHDAVVGYQVTNASGPISEIGLAFDGIFQGSGIASVTETVWNAAGQELGFGSVSCGPSGCNRSTVIPLSGAFDNLTIKKDINVTAGDGSAQISWISQSFNSDPVIPTPEPASVALPGIGLVGVALALLRRRASKVTR